MYIEIFNLYDLISSYCKDAMQDIVLILFIVHNVRGTL